MSSSKAAQVAAERERARQWKEANLRTSSGNTVVQPFKRSATPPAESSRKRRRTISPQRPAVPAIASAPAPAPVAAPPAAGVRSSMSPMRPRGDTAAPATTGGSNSNAINTSSRKPAGSSSAAKQSRPSLSSTAKSRSSTPTVTRPAETSPVPAPLRSKQKPVAPAPSALPPSPKPRERKTSNPAPPVVVLPPSASAVVFESYSKEESLAQQREAARRWRDEQLPPGAPKEGGLGLAAEVGVRRLSGSSKKKVAASPAVATPLRQLQPQSQPHSIVNSILVFIVSSMLHLFKQMWPFNLLFPGESRADDTTAAGIATTVVAVATGGWSAYTLWSKIRAAAAFLDKHRSALAIASATAAAIALVLALLGRRKARARARKLVVDRVSSLVKKELQTIHDFYPIDFLAWDIVDVIGRDADWQGWHPHGVLVGFDPSMAKDSVAALWPAVRAEVERDSCIQVSDRLVQGKQRKCWKMLGLRNQLTPMKM